MAQYLYIWVRAYWFSATSLSKWPPDGHFGFFGFRTNSSLSLIINSKLQWQNTYVYGEEPSDFQWPHFLNGCQVAILDFSVSGWHGFGSVTQVCFGFSFKFHLHVLSGFRQTPNNCQLCRFQNGCLVILNNVQLQSTYCPLPPFPMGRGYPSKTLIYNY